MSQKKDDAHFGNDEHQGGNDGPEKVMPINLFEKFVPVFPGDARHQFSEHILHGAPAPNKTATSKIFLAAAAVSF
jgi:hypothetical protein